MVCGKKFIGAKSMKKCTSCGYVADDADIYCAHCGEKLVQGEGSVAENKVIINSTFLRIADFLDNETLYKAAVCKLNGIRVPKAEDEAIEIFKLLAYRGHFGSMYKLAEIYLNANPPDEEAAKAWLKTAASGGHVQSAVKLKNLNLSGEKLDGITIEDGSLETLVRCALPSIVVIKAGKTGSASVSLGSGFIIDGGYVITNAHVVGDNPEWVTCRFEPKLDEKTYSLMPIAVCPDSDVAVLKFCGAAEDKIKQTSHLSLKLSDVEYGETVYTVGNPLGVGFSVSKGVVSCPDRATSYPKGVSEVIQTDITANHGNSGGALLDKNNNVLGMITFTPGESAGGITMCVPSKYIVQVLNKIDN
jgi:S1-C subfamily serine protease